MAYDTGQNVSWYASPECSGADRVSSLLCVAGAGRGPLVARAFTAIQKSGRNAFIYVVEKNPNAYVT